MSNAKNLHPRDHLGVESAPAARLDRGLFGLTAALAALTAFERAVGF